MLTRVTEYIGKARMALASAWTFVVVFDIVLRTIGTPFQGAPEIIASSIVMIAFLQFAYAIRARAMLRVDAVVTQLGEAPRRTPLVVGYLLGALLLAFIFYSTFDPAIYSWVTGHFEGEGALRAPTWPTYFIILVGSALGAINYVLLMIEEIMTPGGLPDQPPAI